MQAKSTLSVFLVGIFSVISAANAQQPAVAQDTSGTNGATEQSIESPPLAGKALVYVYRQGHMVGAAGHPLIFVNGNFLAVLRNSNYTQLEVPQGTAVISATVAELKTKSNRAYRSNFSSFPPALHWPKCVGDRKKPSCTWDAAVQSPEPKEDHGCAKVDWRHLEEARPEDVKFCKGELYLTSAALDHWIDPNEKSRDFFWGMALPGVLGTDFLVAAAMIPSGDLSAWLQMCGPNSFPKPSSQEADKIRSDLKRGDNSDDWSRCKNAVAAAALILQVRKPLLVETEARRTYYVKWSVTGGGGKMELMDEAKGAKEMHKLHPVKD